MVSGDRPGKRGAPVRGGLGAPSGRQHHREGQAAQGPQHPLRDLPGDERALATPCTDHDVQMEIQALIALHNGNFPDGMFHAACRLGD